MIKKQCKGVCSEIKSIKEFGKATRRPDGLQTWCKECKKTHARIHGKIYRADNKEKLRVSNAAYKAEHKEQASITNATYRANNKDSIRKQQQSWCDKNRGLRNYSNSIIRAKKLGRMVAWADLLKIKQVYIRCAAMNQEAEAAGLDVRFEVDHWAPYLGELVSGLHTHENLKIITENQNRSKGNIFDTEPIPF